MKWRNHLDIADAVADALALPSHRREILRQASIEPDKHGERVLRFDRKGEPYLRWMPHHRPDDEVIEALAWKARRAFLEGREDDAVWCMGKALHFLQDDCVSTGPLGKGHDSSEDAMAELRLSRETVASGVNNAKVSVNFMRECIQSVRPCRDPLMALNRAGLFSGALAASVLQGKNPERWLKQEWIVAKRRFRLVVLPTAILLASAALVASLMANELLIVLLALPALIAPFACGRYWLLKEEMSWFGL